MSIPQERLTSVTYQGVATQTRYTFHFDYLNKKFVKVLLTDSLYGIEQELTQNIDYTVYQKEITLNTPTNKIIKIYRKTDTLPTVSWEEGSVLRATDLTLQDTQVYHLIEESVEGNKTNSEMLNDAIHLANDAMTAASTATNKATEATNSASQAAISATIATNASNVCESLSTHAILPTNAHTATAISTTATGTIPAGTVQSAIVALETNKVSTSDVVNTPTANKILKLNSEGTLPCDITGNAATVSVVAWTGITDKPTTFIPPIATASVLGGVKQGNGITINNEGIISIEPVVQAKVVFNGVGTITILESKNVSSVTRNSTGNYTINFAEPLLSANYAVALSIVGGHDTRSSPRVAAVSESANPAEKTTTQLRIRINAETNYDNACVSVIII